MTKKTILFVDDEPNILSGLRRMLYPLLKDWNMLFVESGANALEILEQSDVNVLVSDMRMPGMNGFELLQTVRKRFPRVIRVMLTGQPDKNVYCEVMAISHYFLWKPAKYDDLKVLFDSIRDLGVSLHDKKLIQLIGGISSLPSLPPLFDRLMELIESQETNITQIAAVINEDIAMAAQILKLVNSAFFSLSRRIETIQEAVAYLGLDILRQLVLAQHLFAQCSKQERITFKLDELWQHSLCTATLAKAIAESDNASVAIGNSAYLAGLLHEIGKLILIRHLPDIYKEILQEVQQQGRSQVQAESERLGTNHAIIGGYLASLWGLPHPITEAMSLYHDTLLSPEICKMSPVLEAVWHANRVCRGDCSQSGKYQNVISKWQHILVR
jgi:HD-like signal output (HDOD) protein/ActR/RegA family two-component response regulator